MKDLVHRRSLSSDQWLSVAVGVVLQSERSPVRLLVRAYTWVAGSVPIWDAYERQSIDVSLSHQCFSPSLSPAILLSLKNKIVPKPVGLVVWLKRVFNSITLGSHCLKLAPY